MDENTGSNVISTDIRPRTIFLFLGQFKSPLVLVLIGASAVSFFVGELFDGLAIFVILIVNAAIGFFLEQRAETSIQALQSLTAPRARVLRGGEPKLILARDVMLNDTLLLEAGDIVAADAEVGQASRLLTNESILTGESMPVEKTERDTLYLGTLVVAGTAVAKVTAIGMNTELGRIAHLLKTADPGPTPLQAQLKKVGNTLLMTCLGVVAIVLFIGWQRATPWMELFIYSISLAVAAVPEGLPAIVTIAMALGVQRLTRSRAFVRSLPAIETLGSVSVICTDKTGTLTTGHMRVREIWGESHQTVLQVAVSCIDAEFSKDDPEGSGDPTEVAILFAAADRGLKKSQVERENPRLSSRPFEAERRIMSIFRQDHINYVKGAVENILGLCVVTNEHRELILKNAEEMSSRGLRVLAVATAKEPEEKDLYFVGLLGIADPPRTEVIEAIKEARGAGILTVMITGDHPSTAAAIAREIGLILDGEEIESRVFARATPEAKLKLVRQWKADGAVVAMTGDGVNDAPALKEAHVGIAMGKTGSEVTRQAADLVLADDNYATIISAVREGRHIFQNIRRAISYLLIGNIAEVVIVLTALLLGLPAPLLAAHLLWINLVTDSLPALTLMAEPLAPDTMKKPPRPIGERILGFKEWSHILIMGILEASVLLIFYVYLVNDGSTVRAQGLTFTALVFSQLFRSFGARSKIRVFWTVGVFSNLWLLAVVLLSGFLQLSLHYIPPAQAVFNLEALKGNDVFWVVGVALIPISVLEMIKLFLGFKGKINGVLHGRSKKEK